MKFPLKGRKYNFYMCINATKYTNLIKKRGTSTDYIRNFSCDSTLLFYYPYRFWT